MARLAKAKIKLIGIIVIVVGLLLLSLGAYFVIASLSNYITTPGAILAFVATLILITKSAIQAVVFPGSFWLWRRSLEAHFCREMSSHLRSKVIDLQAVLETLLKGSLEKERTELLPCNIQSTATYKATMQHLLDTFDLMKQEGTLRRRQLQFHSLLLKFKDALQAAKLTLPSRNDISLWDWLDGEHQDYNKAIFSDYPHNDCAKLAHQISYQVGQFLYQSYGEVSSCRRVMRWLFDNSLGNTDQMRIELRRKYKTEEF